MALRDADYAHVRPSLAEVSALLYDRIGKDGGQVGDVFDNDTTPTGAQVETTITLATNQLVSRVAVPIPDDQVGQGKWLASLYSAAMVALLFVPEQTSDSATYVGLMAEYNAQVESFIEACRLPLAPILG